MPLSAPAAAEDSCELRCNSVVHLIMLFCLWYQIYQNCINPISKWCVTVFLRIFSNNPVALYGDNSIDVDGYNLQSHFNIYVDGYNLQSTNNLEKLYFDNYCFNFDDQLIGKDEICSFSTIYVTTHWNRYLSKIHNRAKDFQKLYINF